MGGTLGTRNSFRGTWSKYLRPDCDCSQSVMYVNFTALTERGKSKPYALARNVRLSFSFFIFSFVRWKRLLRVGIELYV